VITGGSAGVGRATARVFAAEGASLQFWVTTHRRALLAGTAALAALTLAARR
jgi:NAD(P)-dependent dehydrogenase (short-subunit alcohol dehydrogenase family)